MYNTTYMILAVEEAKKSVSKRRKVGCCVTSNYSSHIGVGFNSMPNMHENCEDINGETLLEVVHAEVYALVDFYSLGKVPMFVYCTFSPCINCAKLLLVAGIRELYYIDQHSDTSGIECLKKHGVIVQQVTYNS